jgi:hypothetical protein
MRHSKAKYYRLDKIDHCCGILSSHRGCLHPTWWIYRMLPTCKHALLAMTCATSLPCLNPIVQRAMIVVLAEVLLLVHEVEMQIVDKPHTFGWCLWHLWLLLTTRILREKLWLLWLCC